MEVEALTLALALTLTPALTLTLTLPLPLTLTLTLTPNQVGLKGRCFRKPGSFDNGADQPAGSSIYP